MTDKAHPDPETWWYHRRLQAYIALAGLFLLGIGLFFIPEPAVPLAQSLAWVFVSIVIIYSGGASLVDAVSKLRK